jgi:hypothetical protein
LHEVLDTTVADKIAAIIQSNLPEKCPQKLKKQYTGKSIQQAAITTMLMNPESTFTSGTQLDSYEDKMNIAIAIRGGKIRAGYRPNAECHVPSLTICQVTMWQGLRKRYSSMMWVILNHQAT